MGTKQEKSNPFVNFQTMIKELGYNKDVTLSSGTVIDTAPLTIRMNGNGLETQNLIPLDHLVPQYVPVHLIFEGELGSQKARMLIDNGLEVGDAVHFIYELENNVVKGFILGKEA